MEYLTFTEETEVPQKALKPQKSGAMKDLFDWLDIIVASIVSVVIIFTFLFRVVTIVGDSMQNTFYNGEKIIITNLFYEPEFGDVVVISRNAGNTTDSTAVSEPLIKRVIATGEQYVDIDFDTGKVYVGYNSNRADMTELNEPYIKAPTYLKADVEFPVYVPEGYVFVLGDNRNDSKDSRFSEIGENGLVNEKYILGKAVFRIFPLGRAGKIEDVKGGLE